MDAIVDLAQDAVASPWVYVALFAFAAVDAFLPMVPSESLVITAGVFAATDGTPLLWAVILTAAAGAFVGDHVSYGIGRFAGVRVLARARRGGRARAAFAWAEQALARRGGLVLVIARYIPGGRTAATLTMGIVAFPLRRFSLFDALAALSWGAYSALVGYVGGSAFEESPLKALALGFAIAIAVTGIVELVRLVHRRRGRVAT